jgi:hypothetical protein
MHFFYLDETGCTGADLSPLEQPIFVLGGVSVSDDRWRTTTEQFSDAVSKFFNGSVPKNFELHAPQLNRCEGPFQGKAQDECNAFVHTLIDLVSSLKHNIHFIAIDKAKLAAAQEGQHAVINCKIPYQLGFNYLVSYIEAYVKHQLGKSARGMIILDQKEMYQSEIDALTRYRRFEVPAVRRIKWIVEFSYPVDSVRHPLVQLSDVVIFHVRKFLECENGYGTTGLRPRRITSPPAMRKSARVCTGRTSWTYRGPRRRARTLCSPRLALPTACNGGATTISDSLL